MKRLVLLSLLLLPSAAFAAGKLVEREFTCPVCGTAFYAKLDVNPGQYDMRLDLKPIGDAPAPWRLPDCPKCGFVIYAISLSKAELAAHKRTVASPEYAASLRRSSYYRLGLLYAGMGRPDFAVANAFLKASWQEEASPAELKDDLASSLKYFTAAAASPKSSLVERENSQLLMGELLRRLGRFEECAAHLKALRGTKGFTNNFFGDVVDYQLKLCVGRDAGIYEMEDVRASKRSLFGRLGWQYKKFMRKFEKKPVPSEE